ncbi:TIGR03757 family integrating conjugative element protein [Pseudomonas vanderleydeniana]|uniref:TIGR03757 family integrating conjugative element protein n=1 Tax=Pseudomonas vanderleydeniana TaxID=2745495 RepID=A0A9E6TUU6_9PSED|nr:TIGR03757 family integrating conjugative element protein [Pseudomonas vanderleydeniana]QXI31199.1 TIGR03757 family integrating conjugative element protein [Pseudomonas vanderleydeniana]
MNIPGLLRRCSPLVLLACLTPCLAETWVITDSAHPVEVPAGVRLIHLDRLDQLEVALFENLSPDASQAQAAFQDIMTVDAAADISRAHQDIVDAWSLGVSRIPAVVVDRRYVVYGDPNVERALARIEQFRRAAR